MSLTRRQALALVPALAVGTTVAKEAEGVERSPNQWDAITPMVRNIMRHAWKTGHLILSADEPLDLRIGYVAVCEIEELQGPVTRQWWMSAKGPGYRFLPEQDRPGRPKLHDFISHGWCRTTDTRAKLARKINRWAELCRRPSNPAPGQPPHGRLILP